jgi:hypothetical protein
MLPWSLSEPTPGVGPKRTSTETTPSCPGVDTLRRPQSFKGTTPNHPKWFKGTTLNHPLRVLKG